MKLTKPQQSLFWRTFSAACNALNISDSYAREEYRKQVMLETCGATSIKQLNRTTDFDACMRRFALDAADYETAFHYDSGDERRIAHLVEVCALQLTQLMDDQPDPLAYVIGILDQAGYQGHFQGQVWWLDLTADRLQALFKMLDTHRRRILKRTGSRPLKFDPGVAYGRDHAGTFRASATSYPDTQRLIRVA